MYGLKFSCELKRKFSTNIFSSGSDINLQGKYGRIENTPHFGSHAYNPRLIP
jgi:hypothetical protein